MDRVLKIKKMGYNLSTDEVKMCNKTQALLERRKKHFHLAKQYRPLDLAQLIYNLYQQKMATYFDNGGYHCKSGHLRSTQDLYHLCKRYIKHIPYIDLYKISREMVMKESIFDSHYCGVVHREVYFPHRLNMKIDTIREYLRSNNMNYKAKK